MTSGKIHSDRSIDLAESKVKRYIIGSLGKEGNKLSIQTTSGDIDILKNREQLFLCPKYRPGYSLVVSITARQKLSRRAGRKV